MLLIKEDFTASFDRLKANGLHVVPFILGDNTVLLDFGLDDKDKYIDVCNKIEQLDCKVLRGIEITSKKRNRKTKLWSYKYDVESVSLIRLDTARVYDRDLPVYRVDLSYTD